jgi:PRC-barrel domain protein
MKFPTLTAVTLATALAGVPALANDQPAAPAKTPDAAANGMESTIKATPAPAVTAETNPAASIGTATVNSKDNKTGQAEAAVSLLPHQRNPVLADNGQPRAGKVIGSDVYNMQDKKIGSVDDILMGANGEPDQAVLSVKGKYVLVPFSRLVFGNTKTNGDNRVILPDETAANLKALPEFRYHSENKG